MAVLYVLTGSRRKRAAIFHAIQALSLPVGPFGSSERGAGWSARHEWSLSEAAEYIDDRVCNICDSAVSSLYRRYRWVCSDLYALE